MFISLEEIFKICSDDGVNARRDKFEAWLLANYDRPRGWDAPNGEMEKDERQTANQDTLIDFWSYFGGDNRNYSVIAYNIFKGQNTLSKTDFENIKRKKDISILNDKPHGTHYGH